jgi:hypothetical protein
MWWALVLFAPLFPLFFGPINDRLGSSNRGLESVGSLYITVSPNSHKFLNSSKLSVVLQL